MENQWWQGQPVLEVAVGGNITTREQAFTLSKTIVDDIEASHYPHVIVILDLSKLGQSPNAASLIGGNLPQTNKIEHLVMINAPMLFRMATMPLVHLRDKLHFLGNPAAAKVKAQELLPRLPKL